MWCANSIDFYEVVHKMLSLSLDLEFFCHKNVSSAPGQAGKVRELTHKELGKYTAHQGTIITTCYIQISQGISRRCKHKWNTIFNFLRENNFKSKSPFSAQLSRKHKRRLNNFKASKDSNNLPLVVLSVTWGYVSEKQKQKRKMWKTT